MHHHAVGIPVPENTGRTSIHGIRPIRRVPHVGEGGEVGEGRAIVVANLPIPQTPETTLPVPDTVGGVVPKGTDHAGVMVRQGRTLVGQTPVNGKSRRCQGGNRNPAPVKG